MQRLTPRQVRFELLFGLQKIPTSVLAAMHSKSPEARQRATEAATDILAARFERMEVHQHDPRPNLLDGIGNG